MKYEKAAASAALTTALLTGCASPSSTDVEAVAFQPSLVFETSPETNYSVVNCAEDPHDWGTQTDETPSGQNAELMQATIGGPEVPFRFGATIREVGGVAARYHIVTSAHQPGQSETIDLTAQTYSQIMPADTNYSVVFSARLGADGTAYFDANCLPTDGHLGGQADQIATGRI